MAPCPCNSNKPYEKCCAQYIVRGHLPETPEVLMRSRYTAYTKVNIDYIKNTMRGPATINYDDNDARQWAEQAEWLGLTVVDAPSVQPDETTGFVEFIAKYRFNGIPQHLSERSEFHYIDGRWYYVDGEVLH